MSLINNNMIKVSDNVELDFPARMNDGRMFTDYRQNCILNNSISKKMDSWEYRDYLINNAAQIHNNFMNNLEASVKCTKCSDNTVLPAPQCNDNNPPPTVFKTSNVLLSGSN